MSGISGHGASMLGLWEAGQAPMSMRLHVAFGVDLPELLEAPRRLRAIGVAPLDFWDHETDEPVVFAWMPAAALLVTVIVQENSWRRSIVETLGTFFTSRSARTRTVVSS